MWKGWIISMGLGLALVGLVGCETAQEHSTRVNEHTRLAGLRQARQAQDQVAQRREAAWRTMDYTYAHYLQLEPGMGEEKVAAILGSPGQELSRNQIAGHHTVMYSWSNPDGSNLLVMFQNFAMVQKAQFGLR